MSFQLAYKTCQQNDGEYPPVDDSGLQQMSAAFREMVDRMKDNADKYYDDHLVEVSMVDLDKGAPVDKQVVQCRHQKP